MLNYKHSNQKRTLLLLRITAMLLAILMLPLTLLACAGDPTPTELPDYSEETAFKVTEGDEALVRVVYPAGLDGTQYRSFAGNVAKKIKDWTGVEPEVVTDDEPEISREILVGNTNREFSETAYMPIAKEKLAFTFASNGGKLAILSTAPQAMTYAFAYLDLQYDKVLGFTVTDEGSSFPVNLNVRHSIKIPTTEPSAELLSISTAYMWKASEEISLPVDGIYKKPLTVSAGATELFVAWADDTGKVKIGKYAMNGSLTKLSEALSVNGVAAICYDPTLHMLAVAHGNENKDVTLLDANTLTPVASYTAEVDIEALSYDFVGMRYLAKKKGEGLYVYLNATFALASKTPVTAMSTDKIVAGTVSLCGIGQDQKFLYQLCLAKGTKTRVIMTVQEFSGKGHLVNQVDLGGKVPVTSAKFGKEFFVLSADTAANTVSIQRVATGTVTVTNEPFAVYDGSANINKINTSGVSATHQFNVYDLNSDGKHTVLQGGCTDGTYGYFMMEYQGGSGNYENSWTHSTVVVKVDMATKKVKKKSAALPLGHSNGACYNPLTNEVLVAYSGHGSDGESRSNIVCVVDADTLKLKEERQMGAYVGGLSYNPYTGRYLCSSGTSLVTLDANFNYISKVATIGNAPFVAENGYNFGLDAEEPRILTQSVDCDSKYVYWILSATAPTKWTDYIVAYDHAGNYAFSKIIPTSTIKKEGENIFHIGKTIYVGFNGDSDPVYKITIK